MKHLTHREKTLLKDIERLRELIYSHSTEDPDWEKHARPIKLRIERNEMIRNFIISNHLLTQEWLDLHITKHFVRQKPRSMRFKVFRQHVMERLTYHEKVTLAFKAGVISKGANDFLGKLNALRNKCAHRWDVYSRGFKLTYNGKNLLDLKVFEEFVDDVFVLHEVFWEF
jgi:hypothetical protein